MGNLMNLDGTKGISYKLNEEVPTGDYWVDGKPIYTKTMQFNNLTNTQVLLSMPEIDSLIDIVSMGVTDTEYLNIPYKYNENQATVNYETKNKNFQLFSNLAFIKLVVTLYYTKTGGATNLLNRIKSHLFNKKVGVIYG